MKKLFFLDGIRGWGAFVVLIYHVFIDGFPLSEHSKSLLHHLFFFNGTLAVWVFFIVSGFSLSISYATSGNYSVLLRIACGRYLRLAIPVFIFSVFAYIISKLGFIPPFDERPDRFKYFYTQSPDLIQVISFSLFGVFFDYDQLLTLIPPLWTMSIELLGSFLVLGLCALCGNRRWTIVLYISVFLLSFFLKVYYSAFFVGVLFAELYSKGKPLQGVLLPAFIFIGGACSAVILPNASEHLYLVIAIILFAGMVYCQPIKFFLECKLSKFMGRISFTLYLLHAIVMWSFSLPLISKYSQYDDAGHPVILLVNLATIVLSIGLSRLLVNLDEYSILISHEFSNLALLLIDKIRHLFRLWHARIISSQDK